MLLLGMCALILAELFSATNIHLKKLLIRYLTEDVIMLFKQTEKQQKKNL